MPQSNPMTDPPLARSEAAQRVREWLNTAEMRECPDDLKVALQWKITVGDLRSLVEPPASSGSPLSSEERAEVLRVSLAAAMVPLEVLAGQMRVRPYAEISATLHTELLRAIDRLREIALRARLSAAPPTADTEPREEKA